MNLPNKLTVFRMILIPVFMLVLALPLDWGTLQVAGAQLPVTHLVAAIIFIVASLTDLADGKIARKYKLVTNFGKFADPLADKLLVMTALIFFVQFGWVPAWMVAIIVIRELAITGLRTLIVENNGKVLAAAMPGKIKTASQMVAISFFLLHDIVFAMANIPFAMIMIWIALLATIYSGIDYFYKNRDVFSDGFK
ncbi:CDP-diacylglycerol--glycerol-3-phosphate 3-phosphatidyltransferase [Weissella cibaria]|jgi:CDP-diacylglycerol--glycerol-3-phosphate 3-phosphatidyltransferase|uniref:CDP-diacylglycerol--glycerol-3-phosphate 3-phosphatidyltransferase n=4 Tax=Weissella cibaria TaxID=137591 RepID=A0A0N9Y6Z0_9LACO|nr:MULTISPECIES: CDP-diacylglycerol--glycerol-3-phosphate 3-phosphatidyltransferase [Weissella]ALI33666.1 CDP-diacylglycerol--glycerol-3-phosphate 3-phosphatidyltransferase [Weissella cibaria]APS27768.1 CDP-diacylglycerol--glycerol-3-phosphate 3-phosphatidyltransferase [Weissella cibaria]APU63166.1 CDP-diacylglycerol--glycerol-3-phosphate 3-phosphatidyltransferase [Weissella cibaria]APU65317.1 CDP-diacylglycerol--glycerol-3-phosphate 3-phosphatidyltransferase [Weissella cibaria]ASS51306.1 CDP-